MTQRNTIARSLSEVGLATWFGGSLMGAVGVNGAAAKADPPEQRARVANAGWSRWTPVNLTAIGAHLVGSALLTGANKGRIIGQRNVASTAIAKTALTASALVATAYARSLGQKMMKAGDVPVQGSTEPSAQTPPEVAGAQRKLQTLQWVIPALTGSMLVMDALMGEQQRPTEVAAGIVGRILPDRLAA